MDKKARLTALADKLAAIIEQDLARHGEMKPSYLSPKFWAHVEAAMKARQAKRSESHEGQ